jgi:hypothetical protein
MAEPERGQWIYVTADSSQWLRCWCGEPGCEGWAMGRQWEDAIVEDQMRSAHMIREGTPVSWGPVLYPPWPGAGAPRAGS